MAATALPDRASRIAAPADSSVLTSSSYTPTPSYHSTLLRAPLTTQTPNNSRTTASSASAEQVRAAYLRAWNAMNSTSGQGLNGSRSTSKSSTKSASQPYKSSHLPSSARPSKSLPSTATTHATRPSTPPTKHVSKGRRDKSHKSKTAAAETKSTKGKSQHGTSTTQQLYDAWLADHADDLEPSFSTSRSLQSDAMMYSPYTWPSSLGSPGDDSFDSDPFVDDSGGGIFSDDEDSFWKMAGLSPSTSPMQESPTLKAASAAHISSTDSGFHHPDWNFPDVTQAAGANSIFEPFGTQSTASSGYPYSLVAAYPYSTYVTPVPSQPAAPERPSYLGFGSGDYGSRLDAGLNDPSNFGLPNAQNWTNGMNAGAKASSSKIPSYSTSLQKTATSSTSTGFRALPADPVSNASLDTFQSVFNDLNRDVDIGGKGAMARIFEQDKEAVAEMSDLPLCSAEALEELKERGLTTQLKTHQSSALRFLVEAEHRRVPQVPQDEEVCLWRAQRFGRQIRWVNRVVQQLQPIPPELPRGAILADDMGLGKTLTILSLILSCEDGGIIIENRNKLPLPKKEAPKKAGKGKGKAKSKSVDKIVEIDEEPAVKVEKSITVENLRPAIADNSLKSRPKPKPFATSVKREQSPDVVVLEQPPSKKVKKEVIDLCEDEEAKPEVTDLREDKDVKKEVIDLGGSEGDKDLWAAFDDDSDIAEIDIDQIVSSQATCKTEQSHVMKEDDDDLWGQIKIDDDDFEILDDVLSSQTLASQATSCATSPESTTFAARPEVKSEARQIAPLGSVHSSRRPSADSNIVDSQALQVPASAPVKSRSPSPVPIASVSSSLPASARSSPGVEEVKPVRPRASNPTLIVCPLSVLSNWTGQADAHVSNPPLKYAVMHGKETHILKGVADWGQYDFMLTTYDSLKASRRRLALLAHHRLRISVTNANIQSREKDLEKAESWVRSAPSWHRDQAQSSVNICKEALADAKERRMKQVICPPKRSGDSDYGKMKACEPRAQRVRARKGNDEDFTDDELYEIWTGCTERPPGERIFEQQWLRVILDEAHVIRNASTQTFEAVRALRTERRVAVTGTPIVNSTRDLGSLAAWIGIQPFSDETSSQRLWNEHVEKGLPVGDGYSVKILRAITKTLVILRTKEMEVDGKPLVELPEIKSFKYEIEMHLDDMKLYREAETKLREKLIEWAESGELHKKNANILVILGRLRQLANDRRLVPNNLLELISRDMGEVGTDADGRTKAAAPAILTAAQIQTLRDILQAKIEDGESCKLCNQSLGYSRDGVDPPLMAPCGHAFHKDCISQRMQTDKTCPMDARQLGAVSKLVSLPITSDDAQVQAGDRTGRDSNKIESVAKIVHTVYATAPHDKTIIFSNFVGLLRLIEARLERDGVPFVTLYGCHSKAQREVTLASFNRPLGVPQIVADAASTSFKNRKLGAVIPRVILMSMGAGSVGLNLTVANNVILVDPWWNEAMQLQAINRAHRIGQTKEVNVHRLVSKDTVEERVVQIANEKIELATFALSGVKHNGKSVFNGSSKSTMRNIGALVGMTQEQRARFAAAARNN